MLPLPKMYGYPSTTELLADQPLVKGKVYVDPGCRQQILQQIEANGYISNYEVQVYRQDGSTLWISESCWPVYDDQGSFAYFEGFIKDITESKEIAAALERSKLQSQAIVTAIPDLMFRVSREGIYLGYVSTNQLTDLLPNEYQPIGQPLTQYLPVDVAHRHITHLEQALSTGEIQVYEQCHQLADRQQYEEVRVVPIDHQEALFMIRDISTRKQAETALIEKNRQLEAALQQLQQAQGRVSPGGENGGVGTIDRGHCPRSEHAVGSHSGCQ
jgi:PAS domain S-box-containing protein